MNRYLSIDCEMGGTEINHSLLQVAVILADENFFPTDKLVLNLKPNDGDYIVTPQGLCVNKIDLVAHDKTALNYKQGGTQLYDWLLRTVNKGIVGGGFFNKSGKFLKPVGKGIHGDLEFIWKYLISKPSWYQFVSHSPLDLTSVWTWAEITGAVPILSAHSLIDIAESLGVEYDMNKLHGAKYDAELTLSCFRELYKRMGQ